MQHGDTMHPSQDPLEIPEVPSSLPKDPLSIPKDPLSIPRGFQTSQDPTKDPLSIPEDPLSIPEASLSLLSAHLESIELALGIKSRSTVRRALVSLGTLGVLLNSPEALRELAGLVEEIQGETR